MSQEEYGTHEDDTPESANRAHLLESHFISETIRHRHEYENLFKNHPRRCQPAAIGDNGDLLGLALLTVSSVGAATISVQADKPGHKIAPTLWGIFFEDINLSADGGIYPELVRNRSFEDGDKPEHWKLHSVNEGANEMAIDSSRPLR